MKAALIQRQISLNEQTLTGLYEEYSNLRKARKACNEESDTIAQQILDGAERTDDELKELCDEENAFRELSSKYTPYIRKFKKKIAAVEELQRVLKSELKVQQSIETFVKMDDQEWKQLAKMAQQEDYKVSYSYDELAEMFKEDE